MARTATVLFKNAEDAKLAMQLTNTPFLDRGIMIHAQTFGARFNNNISIPSQGHYMPADAIAAQQKEAAQSAAALSSVAPGVDIALKLPEAPSAPHYSSLSLSCIVHLC